MHVTLETDVKAQSGVPLAFSGKLDSGLSIMSDAQDEAGRLIIATSFAPSF